MSRHDEFFDDRAMVAAIDAAASGLDLIAQHQNDDPAAAARLVAMMALVAFTNAGGLDEPSIGKLRRFAPDLGCNGFGGDY